MGEFNQAFMDSVNSQLSTLSAALAGKVPGAAGGSGGGMGIVDTLTCPIGSECYKTKHNKYLQNKLEQAQRKLDSAPIDLSRAERNYYDYNAGETGGDTIYTTLISDRFAETANEFKKNSIDRQQQFMSDISQALRQYQSQSNFQSQADKLVEMRQAEQDELIKNINYYQKILQTSERKVVFENKNSDSLYSYRRMMVFVYYAGIICFILFGNFIPDKLYTKYSVWLLIVIVSIIPIILNIAIIWMFVYYDMLAYWFEELPHRDVYKKLGEPASRMPMPSSATAPPRACRPTIAATSTSTSASGSTSTSTSTAPSASLTKRPIDISSIPGMPVIPAETKAAMMSAMSPSMVGLLGG